MFEGQGQIRLKRAPDARCGTSVCRKLWYIYSDERTLHHVLSTGRFYHVLSAWGASKRALLCVIESTSVVEYFSGLSIPSRHDKGQPNSSPGGISSVFLWTVFLLLIVLLSTFQLSYQNKCAQKPKKLHYPVLFCMHHCLRQIFAYLIGRPMIFLRNLGRVEMMSQVTVFCRHTTRCVFSERRFFSTGKTWPTEMKVWKHTGQPLPHVGCPNAIWKRQLQSKVRVRRKKNSHLVI